MKFVAELVMVSMLLAVPQLEACSCFPAHPQQHYCHSDFVIHAVVGNRTELEPALYTAYYEVTILDIFKGLEHSIYIEDNGDNTTKSATIWTSSAGSMCGVNLETGVEYVLAGRLLENGLHVNLCDLFVRYDSLTRRQKNGFQHKYRDNCDCKVKYCGGFLGPCSLPAPPPEPCTDQADVDCGDAKARPPPPSNECQLHWHSGMPQCAESHTLCRRVNGGCQWSNNRHNQICRIHTSRRLRTRR